MYKKKFIWDESMSVGHGLIDSQHKKLFDIANELLELAPTVSNKNGYKKIILFLIDYIKTHFNSEENWMEEIQYPWLDTHKLNHLEIVEKVNNAVKTAKNLEELHNNLIAFMSFLVLDHIKNQDLQIKFWCQQSEMVFDIKK